MHDHPRHAGHVLIDDPAVMTAAELAAGYAARRFSPVEITEALLRRAHALNLRLNALYLFDDEAALAAARASTERWASGTQSSPLDGVPTTIKDALPSIGHPSYRGSAAHPDDVRNADTDAPVVARMREAGMVFLGKTTMPDFGILASGYSSKHGVARNPWRLDRTPGGSSAGAAASIAAGLNPVAAGTDIVGSIRLPASFTGLVGFKPSQGRVPYYVPNSPSLVAGPMARTVHDAALLMNVIAQPDARDFTALPPQRVDYAAQTIGPARIALIHSLGFGVEPDPEVAAAVEQAARLLADAGHQIVTREAAFSPDHLREAERFYKARCRTEFLGMPPHRQKQAEVIGAWSAEADTMTAVDLYRAFNRLQQMREATIRLMHDCDFLLLPTVPWLPFAAEQPGPEQGLFAPWLNTFLFNITEQPASSIPCAVSRDGLPIGLQIVGRRYDDAGVFALSAAFERLHPMREALDNIIAGQHG